MADLKTAVHKGREIVPAVVYCRFIDGHQPGVFRLCDCGHKQGGVCNPALQGYRCDLKVYLNIEESSR